MKKLILSLTGMGVAVTLIFASCQKEEVSRKSETETAKKSVNDNTEEETKVGGVTFVTQWNGNSCVKPAHRCLPEFVVTPKMIESFRVVNDNEEEYDYVLIAEYVENNINLFTKLFGVKVVKSLLFQKNKISAEGTINEEVVNAYLIVSTEEGETVSVRPILN